MTELDKWVEREEDWIDRMLERRGEGGELAFRSPNWGDFSAF